MGERLEDAAAGWRAIGGGAVKQRNGEWMFTLANPMRLKISVKDGDTEAAERIINAVAAAQAAAKRGENPVAALVAAL